MTNSQLFGCITRGFFGLLALASLTQAQHSSTPPSPSAGTAGNAGLSGSRGTLSSGNLGSGNNVGLVDQRSQFLIGAVIFDDGTPANSDIRIERVCGGSSRLEAHTDTKGRFSIQLGGATGQSAAEGDASNDFDRGMVPTTGTGGTGSSRGTGSLFGCELRAAYPGYVSESRDLSMNHSIEDSNLGTLILHRLTNVKGTTLSLTTALAPKQAQKNFEKGVQLLEKGKVEEAGLRFAAATAEYPKFAAAWFHLGQVQEKLSQPEEAKTSYLAAIAADNHYVSPYDRLAHMSAQQGKWEDAATYSKEAVDLNPVEFPSSFWYNALANYNMKKNAEAEKSARALLKLDSQHQYPQAETMLAEIQAHSQTTQAKAAAEPTPR